MLAVSVPERQTVTDRTPPPPPPEVEVKVVGIGSRGAYAINKLIQHSQVQKAELWCLDVDRAALEAAPTPNTLLLPKDDPSSSEGKVAAADLARIIGRAASDAGGRGNINAGTDGAITFVLAPAAAAPGGAATVLQIVAALRAAGHFTVAAVTQPFGFEGNAKREQAAELIAELKRTAHVVAVMEQDVLMQAFGDAQMTVSEATNIADTALEHAVLCILQAVQAEEVLKSARGALMWHGRDMRHFKRILPPPLQQLLTRPGTAVLGRGLASMPAEAAHQMGAAQALMHLASDAVRAAAESPFLDGALYAASGVLCCIDLPPTGQQVDTGAGGSAPLQDLQTPDGERRAVRLAAQAAAGALGSMSGQDCQDFVLRAEPLAAAPVGADSGTVCVEATLLVMRSSGEDTVGAPATGGGLVTRQPLLQQPQAGRFGVGPAVPAPPRQQPQRLPSSSWGLMSAMAGGKATPAGQRQPRAPTPQQQQPRAPSNLPNFFGSGRTQQQPTQPAGQQQVAAAAAASTSAAPPQQQQQQRVPVQRAEAPAPDQPQPAAAAEVAAAPSQAPAAADASQLRRETVGDYIAKSKMTAQSLDLSPAAARWRQEQRSDDFEQRKLIVWEVDGSEPEPWQAEEEESFGLAALLPPGLWKEKKKVDIKGRMASILSQDREDAWVADNGSSDE